MKRATAAKFLRRVWTWRWRDQILLAMMVLAIGLANLIWIRTETRPPHWDMARHLWISLNYFALAHGGHIKALILSYYYYPPLLYLLVLPWYTIFGNSLQVAVVSNIVFIAILAYSTYGIGRRLWDRTTGLLSSVLVLTLPMLVSQFKEFQIDAPLTAITALALYGLIASDEFGNLGYSIGLGFILGLGFLTKWTFPLIIGLPLVVAAAKAIIRAINSKSTQSAVNLALCGLIAYTVSSFWYVTNQHQLKIDLLANGVNAGAREGDPVIKSWASLTWYINNLANHQLYLLPLILVLVGVVITFRHSQNLKRNLYPILLVIGTWTMFTLLRNKDARYTLPFLPALAVVASFWIAKLKAQVRNWAIGGVLAYSIMAFLLISFGWSWLPTNLTIGPITVFAQHGYIIGLPTHEDWRLPDVFERIARNPRPSLTYTLEGIDTIWFNEWDMQYYALRYHIQLVSQAQQPEFFLQRTLQVPPVEPGYVRVETQKLPDSTNLVLDEAKPE